MENVTQSPKLFFSIEKKLHSEINVLQEAMGKIDRYSNDPGDQWVYPVYERIIERRKKLLAYLTA